MAEPGQLLFTHKEVVEALVKQQGLHEGLWMLYMEFGIQGVNMGPSDDLLVPGAIVPVQKIGLQRGTKENSLTVDAAKVNPRPKDHGKKEAKTLTAGD
jgi:hypothetical protein